MTDPGRPAWWPRGLWPPRGEVGERRREPRRPPASDPVEGSYLRGASDSPPVESFLRTLVEALEAEGSFLFRLEPGEGLWHPERSAGRRGGSVPAVGPLASAGHPLTWCLREELTVQMATSELLEGLRTGGWCLAGPVRDHRRVVVLSFAGSPPRSARSALEPALQHLSALLSAGLP